MFKIVGRFVGNHQKWFGVPLVIAMALLATAIATIQPAYLELAALKTLDVRFLMRGPIEPTSPIYIVAVDNDSLEQVGRWPWSRDLTSVMINRLVGEYKVKALGFDMVFSEEQRNPLQETSRLMQEAGVLDSYSQQWLEKYAAIGNLDAQFEDLLGKYRKHLILGYFYYPDEQSATKIAIENAQLNADDMFDSAMSITVQGDGLSFINKMVGVNANLTQFVMATEANGFFSFSPDEDGTVRRVPLMATLAGEVFPSINLQTLRLALDWPKLTAEVGNVGLNKLALGNLLIPTDQHGSMLINHYGAGQTFRHISAVDLLRNEVENIEELKDAIVILGVTATGVYDYRPTPFDATFPGVEAHAAAMANILEQKILQRPDWLMINELFAVFFFSLLCGIIIIRRSPMIQVLGFTVVPIAVFFAAQYMFEIHYLWVKTIYLIGGVLLATIPVIMFEYLAESYRHAHIHDAFSRYLAPEVVEMVAKNPEMLNLGGDERHMTAMFSDIAAFSSFSEILTATELVAFLNQYLTAMSDIIMADGGTVDKYEGDAIIAFFGAPLSYEDHALRCVRSVLEQDRALCGLRQKWRDEGLPDVYVRFGVNSGSMVVGNMGTEQHMNYTIMGDNVNLASRLEGVNKVYATPIMLSHDTYNLVSDNIYGRFLDRARVVGRKTPVDLYMPLGEIADITASQRELDERYRAAWMQMQNREFAKAELQFGQLAEQFQDKTSHIMQGRVQAFLQTAPADNWDGVHNLTSK
ncbi:MAG: adenylate/guanylate cyclase domain-containing protein [Mariprofundales bacterium]